jgi:hypothetical protein
MASTRLFYPLFRRRSILLPTWRVWVLLVTLMCLAMWFLPHKLFRVLAVSAPVGKGILVIEGWVPDQAVRAGVLRYQSGTYAHIVTTGVPIELGFHLNEYGSTADVARATCLHLGVDSAHVSAAPAHGHIIRDRTLASAYALGDWLRRSAPGAREVDIVTQGIHARRTRLIFARVLGDSIRVGVIAERETQYDERDWWKTSAGVKDVGGEILGFIYAAIGKDQPPEE